MDAILSQIPSGYGTCKNQLCVEDASVVCKTHSTVLCTCCSVAFHSVCNIKILNEKDFLIKSIQFFKDLAGSIDNHGFEYSLNSKYPGFQDDLTVHKENLKRFELSMNSSSFSPLMIEDKINEISKMIRNIQACQAYQNYCTHQAKLKIISKSTQNICTDEDTNILHRLGVNFFFDSKRKECEFRENTLKGIALDFKNDVNKSFEQVNMMRSYCDQSIENWNNKFNQNVHTIREEINDSIDKKIHAMEERILSIIDQKLSLAKQKNHSRLSKTKNKLKTLISDTTQEINCLEEKFDIFCKDLIAKFEDNSHTFSNRLETLDKEIKSISENNVSLDQFKAFNSQFDACNETTKQKLIELENLIKDKNESEEASKKYLDSSSELIKTLVGDLVKSKMEKYLEDNKDEDKGHGHRRGRMLRTRLMFFEIKEESVFLASCIDELVNFCKAQGMTFNLTRDSTRLVVTEDDLKEKEMIKTMSDGGGGWGRHGHGPGRKHFHH